MKFAEVQVGVPYPEKKFKVTEAAVKAYLAAVEDYEPLYGEERLVPPAYAAVYTRWEALTGEQLENGTVHMKQVFRYHYPIHWDETLTLRGQVKEKMEKRGMKFVVQKVEAFNEAGELAAESEITIKAKSPLFCRRNRKYPEEYERSIANRHSVLQRSFVMCTVVLM